MGIVFEVACNFSERSAIHHLIDTNASISLLLSMISITGSRVSGVVRRPAV
jgi:hypothetical protein